MVAVLVQIDGYDPVTAAAVTLYAASHDDPAVCMLNGQTWWPALANLPTLRYDLFDGAFGGSISAPASSLSMQAEPWPNLGRYMLADARLRLWTGSVGAAWASYTLRFDGRITGQPKLADGRAEIDFAVDDRWLDTAFLATYAGTTGIEGPAALKGQVKPLALGAPRYVPGKLIDVVNSVFQVSAYGAVQGFDYALERLARFGAATSDYATYAALIAATLAPGTWATCKASGLARFGAPPTGQVSFLLQGDNSGTDGWARKPGQLIRRLALLSGGTGKIDDTSLNALDTARAYNLSLYLEEQTTAREIIQKIAASVNAVAGVSWTGQLFLLPVGIGAATVTLAADGSALPPVGPVQQIEIAAPFRKLALTAERAWTVHQLGDIASTATLVDLGGYATGATYREGNIVELPSGARYMYSAVTPTAGNAPPNATYWTVLPAAASTDFTNVSGATKPENNATVGAAWGVNVTDPAGTRPGNNATADLTFTTAGTSPPTIGTGVITGTAAGWKGWARSTQARSGPMRVSGRMVGLDSFIMLTVNTTPADPNTTYQSGTISVHRSGGSSPVGKVSFWSGATPLVDLGLTYNGVTFADATAWEVIYDGAGGAILRAGGEFMTSFALAPPGPMYAAAALGATTAQVADLDFDAFPMTAQLDQVTGQALNARILRQFMVSGASAAIYNINPLSISRTSGVATITINAHTITDDVGTISYSAGSIGGVTAAPGLVGSVYEDGSYTGGARTYIFTTNAADLAGSPDRRFVGVVTIPADGGTATGGGNGQTGGRGLTNPLP